MNYEEFDIVNFEDKDCTKILSALRNSPMTAWELSEKIQSIPQHVISTKLQKLKNLGMVSNVKDFSNIYYWGIGREYRKVKKNIEKYLSR